MSAVPNNTTSNTGTGTYQFPRKISIVLADSAGNGMDFSAFKVQFQVRRGDYQNPNSADIRIFNLQQSTFDAIQNEYTQVAIQAGYPGNYGLIFTGGIVQTRYGRIDQKDNYVDVLAADGDEAYQFSTMALSLAAGAETAPANTVQYFVQAMARAATNKVPIAQNTAQNPVTAPSPLPNLSTNGLPRGRVFYGPTRDQLREFCLTNSLQWSIQDGQLTLIPNTSYITGEVPVVGPNTGLIGVPEQTQTGIKIRVLLNPSLRIGQTFKLDSQVNTARLGLGVGPQIQNQLLQTIYNPAADGVYYVMIANHTGDTRGNDWYTDIISLRVNAQIPPAIAPQAGISTQYGPIVQLGGNG